MPDDVNMKEKLSYLAAVLENVTDIVSILDITGKIVYESSAIKGVLGYEPEELIGKNAFSFVHPEDYKKCLLCFFKSDFRQRGDRKNGSAV